MADLYLIAVAGGKPHRLTTDRYHNSNPMWSPDGRELLYTVTLIPESHRIGAALRAVNFEGSVRDLICEWGMVTAAAWHPNGQQVVFIGTPEGQSIGTQDQLWVVARQGGQPSCRTDGLSYKVGGALQMEMPARFLRTPRVFIGRDGRAYVQVQQGGTVAIYTVALSGELNWSILVDGDRAAFPMDLRNETLLYLHSTLHDPLQLCQIALPKGAASTLQPVASKPERLTNLNASLRDQWDALRVDALQFASVDGTMVEGWLMLSAKVRSPLPTILYIHGGPHSVFGHIFFF